METTCSGLALVLFAERRKYNKSFRNTKIITIHMSVWLSEEDINKRIIISFPYNIYRNPNLQICILLSLGLQRVHFKENFRNGYFRRDSRSVEEHNKFLQFYNYTKMPYMVGTLLFAVW